MSAFSARVETQAGTQWMAPALVGFGNLLVSAFFERFLTDDTTATSLSLYLLLQFTAMVLLVSSVYYGHLHEILHRCRVYPLDPSQRIRYLLRAMSRTRVLLGFGGSTLFSVGVLFHTPWPLLIVSTGLTLLGCAAATCMWSILLLIITRHHIPPGVLLIPLGLGVFAVAILIATSTMVDLLVTFPVAGWIACGILETARGELIPAAVAAGGCILLVLFALWGGRRYA